MLSVWVPEKERGKLGSVVFGGGQVSSNFFFQKINIKIQNLNFKLDFQISKC